MDCPSWAIAHTSVNIRIIAHLIINELINSGELNIGSVYFQVHDTFVFQLKYTYIWVLKFKSNKNKRKKILLIRRDKFYGPLFFPESSYCYLNRNSDLFKYTDATIYLNDQRNNYDKQFKNADILLKPKKIMLRLLQYHVVNIFMWRVKKYCCNCCLKVAESSWLRLGFASSLFKNKMVPCSNKNFVLVQEPKILSARQFANDDIFH